MYGFLFDQTYINLIILGFFLFLIMFLWRKITIIEGNYFILEKRVDMFKKTERDHLISKNIEKADIVMNEIFKDSTTKKGGYCNNINYSPNDTISQKTSADKSSIIEQDEQDIDTDEQTVDISKYINIINTPEVPNDIKNKIEIIDPKYKENEVNPDTSVVEEKVISPISSVINIDNTEENRGINNDIMDVINITTGDNLDNDAISISSDITFGSDHDKSITKKYKKMSIEKLREECIEKSLNAEGSKAILIARILEYNKKS